MKAEQLNDKNWSLNFVDYGHDEVAMSPEAADVIFGFCWNIFVFDLCEVLLQFLGFFILQEGEIYSVGQHSRDFEVSDETGMRALALYVLYELW